MKKKTGLTEIIGYGQFLLVWALGIATWYVATDAESISGKIAVFQALATFAGAGVLGVVGRKAYTEVMNPDAGVYDPESDPEA